MSRKRTTGPGEKASSNRWADLTWADLEEWAGGRSLERGRSYQRGGHVRELAQSDEGVLLASVRGTQMYATRVELVPGQGQKLASRCACPVGFNGCKHAVAVVLEYLEALKHQRTIPEASEDDPRWLGNRNYSKLYAREGRDS